jgi:CRP-like cAMP-binding protein
MINELLQCSLFQGLTTVQVSEMLKNKPYHTQDYSRGETIAFEGDPCTVIGVVVSGKVFVTQMLVTGSTVVIDTLCPGNTFGEVIIFSRQRFYPATIVAAETAKIIFFSQENILKLFNSSDPFLKNFVSLLSNKILMLNKKVKTLSQHSVRQKVIFYLLDTRTQQKHNRLHFHESRQEMADLLGIPRPSLSRELCKLRDEGLIRLARDGIELMDLPALEAYLN